MDLVLLRTVDWMKGDKKRQYNPGYFTDVRHPGSWIIEVCPECGHKGMRWNNGEIAKRHVCWNCNRSYI